MSTVLKNTVIPLYFNSRDRVNINDQTTDYTIRLHKDLRNISSISVSNVGIPRTYTNINRNNNVFLITFFTEGIIDTNTTFNVEIPTRDYTELELQTILQDVLDVSQDSIAIGLDWTITYDTDLRFYSLSVQYDPGASITWGISFTYTPLVDVIGIGNGGTTNNSYLFTATNTDTLIIPVNRKTTLNNHLQFNVTSNVLTNDINTSYITSLAKSFTINNENNEVVLDTVQTLSQYISQLALGTGSIGDISFGQSVDISGDGQTIISGAPNDDGFNGATYTFIRQDAGVDYFQTPTGSKTQTTQFLSANGREGTSVALSTDGQTMITGSPGDDWILLANRMQGAAHIYVWTGAQWVQRFKITPTSPDISQDQQLGTHVAISGDGFTVAASGSEETVVYRNIDNVWELSGRFTFTTNPQLNSNGTILTLYSGGNTIEIWTLNGSTWGLTQSIIDNSPVVGISDDGLLLVTSGVGSVNVYIDTGTYVLDGAPLTQFSGQFGSSVSISGDGTTIAVGDPSNNPGDVWVYSKTGTWNLDQQLTHTVTSTTDPNIGGTVKLSTDGRTLVTSGASADSSIGSIWVWRYNTINVLWEEVDTSNPIRPIGFSSDTDQGFSSSIAHGGNVFVTGGPLDNASQGAVWVYNRDRFLWNQTGNKIVASDLSDDSEARFGYSVSLSGDGSTFAVGAIRDFGGGTSTSTDTGAVWVYRYDSVLDTWNQQGNKIFGSPFVTDQFQGTSVSLSNDGNILAIGAPRTSVPDSGDGSVFIFVWNGSWVQQGSALKHTGLTTSTANGWSVSLNADGDILVIGAPADNAVSIFTRSGVTWTENPTLLTGTGGASSASYGECVSISSDGSTIAVGAPGLNAGDQGYVEIWVFTNSNWVLQQSITETPFANSVDLSSDGNVLCVGSLDGLTQIDITSRTYAYTRTNNTWTQFDDPIIGERRTNTEDYQGFSSSVEYINDSMTDFVLIIGGIGFGAFQGGNWSYISNGVFNTTESFTVPTRAYTIFDLINVLNTGLSSPINLDFVYTFNEETNNTTISTLPDEGVSATFAINSVSNTFNIFEFKEDIQAITHDSLEMDFSINNNIIKSVDTSSTTVRIYDTDPNLIFRKYEAGYTIPSSTNIDIQLRDERDRIVDLYGADWVMTAYATIHN